MAPVDVGKLRAHLDFLRRTVRRLERVKSGGSDAFLNDEVLQAATIRWLQTAVEAVLDIANHVIAREGLGLPKAYSETIEILVRERVLPPEQRSTLLAMVRFRNRVVHPYDEVSPAEIWRIPDERLGDLEAFSRAVIARYLTGP